MIRLTEHCLTKIVTLMSDSDFQTFIVCTIYKKYKLNNE